LLGFFLGFARGFRYDFFVYENLDHKGLLVIRSQFVNNAVNRFRLPRVVQEFLKRRFKISISQLPDIHVLQNGLHLAFNKIRCGFNSGVQVYGSDDCLIGIDEDRALFAAPAYNFTPAEVDKFSQANPLCQLKKIGGAYKKCFYFAQFPFVQIRK